MSPIDHKPERTLDATPRVVWAPWAGAQLCIDAYETGIEVAADVQLSMARAVPIEPIRSFASAWVAAMRDIGAAQLSTVRWFLDV